MLTYDDERICKNTKWSPTDPSKLGPGPGAVLSPPPDTFNNPKSKTGIASLPGDPGFPSPLLPLVMEYMRSKKLPDKMLKSSYFKIAMGEGGSALGKFADSDPYNPGKKLEDWPLKW